MQMVGRHRAQIHRVFQNLRAVAAAAGGSLDDVVKVNVFLTDLGALRQGQRNHGHLFPAALSGARGSGRGLAAARRAGRGRCDHALPAAALTQPVDAMARPQPAPAAAQHPTLAGLSAGMLEQLAKLGIAHRFDLRAASAVALRGRDPHLCRSPMRCPGSERAGGGQVIDSRNRSSARARSWSAAISDGSGELMLRFLNFYPSQEDSSAPGKRVRVIGEVRKGFFGAEMVHPRYRVVRETRRCRRR